MYELTEWGFELEPVLLALGRWGARAPGPPEDAVMSLDAHIVSLRTLFDPEIAGDFSVRLNIRLGESPFSVEVAGGRIRAERGEVAEPDATIDTGPGTLIALVHGRRELGETLATGEIEIDGDQQAVVRFLGLFPLPEPALAQVSAAR